MRIVEITWLDHMIDEGRNVRQKQAEKLGLVEMHSVGFLAGEDENCIRISPSMETHDGENEFSIVLVIAKKLITEIREMGEDDVNPTSSKIKSYLPPERNEVRKT